MLPLLPSEILHSFFLCNFADETGIIKIASIRLM